MTDAPTFPISLTHPGFRPATLGMGEQIGTPIKFPPVVVHDQKQFDYHQAQGYVIGTMNPPAFAAVSPSEPDSDGSHEFPKWVRNAARTKEALVHDAAEEAAEQERFAREEVAEAQQAKERADAALAATREPHDDVRAEVAELRQGLTETRAGLSRMESMLELLLEQRTAPAAPTGAGKGRSGERGA